MSCPLARCQEMEIGVVHDRMMRWIDQGSPVNAPVIVTRGALVVEGERRYVTGWGFDCNFQKTSIGEGELWDYLAQRYPESVAVLAAPADREERWTH